MKLVILDADTLGSDVDLSVFEQFGSLEIFGKTQKEQTLSRVKNADIVITNKVVIDKTIMLQSNIKLICIAATGMNNVDLQAAKELDIEVKNVAGYSTKSVVQHTFAMLFYLLEKMNYYDNVVKSGSWSNSGIFTDVSKPFFEIAGKKWGIIGLGAIGQEVAKIASAFGCEVCYYSTSGQNSNSNFQRVELEELLKGCDIVSIHSPLNENTLNLLNSSNLNLLKDGSILLNLGRGGIINEDDLAIALKNQNILVGLDVVSREPIEANNPLMQIKQNLLITPHIAWTSKEAREKLIDGIVQNIYWCSNKQIL